MLATQPSERRCFRQARQEQGVLVRYDGALHTKLGLSLETVGLTLALL